MKRNNGSQERLKRKIKEQNMVYTTLSPQNPILVPNSLHRWYNIFTVICFSVNALCVTFPESTDGGQWLDSGPLTLDPRTTSVVFSATKGPATTGFDIEGDIAIDRITITAEGGGGPVGPPGTTRPPFPGPPVGPTGKEKRTKNLSLTRH